MKNDKSKKKMGKKVSKPVKHILEFYYMTPQETDAKDMSFAITCVPEEQIEVWRELNLMEVVLEHDSLIFQDARECFIDPLDLEFIQKHKIISMYEISFDAVDKEKVAEVLKELLAKKGGFICSDTEDFEPIFK